MSAGGTAARAGDASLERGIERFIEAEARASHLQVLELHRLTVDKRVAAGESVDGLKLLDTGDRWASFTVARNNSRFRTGDPCYLGDGVDATGGLECEYADYDPVENVLVLDLAGRGSVESLERGRPYVVDRRHIDMSAGRLGALYEVFGDHPRGEVIRRVLSREAVQVTDDPARRRAEAWLEGQGLDNEAQELAIAGARSTEPLYLIQGPPGTGKTHVIAKLLRLLLEDGNRVLLCCLTHRAINNAMNAALRECGPGALFRVCRDHHAEDLDDGIDRVRSWRRLGLPTDSPYVVGATVFAAYQMRDSVEFDVAVFDEAGQLTVDAALMGMLCAPRYVFVGDHRQLGPIILGEHSSGLFRASFFEYLAGRYPAVMLDVTYRMNDVISGFPSRRFYSGRLKPGNDARSRRLRALKRGGFEDILDPEKPSVFVRVEHDGSRMRCVEEAGLAARLALELVESYEVSPGDVAVIAPFRAQVNEIRRQLSRLDAAGGGKTGAGVLVDTVERLQGQEREAVIISFTSSDPAYLEEVYDFYYQPNRLNVAITRPRVKLVMIGSDVPFTAPAGPGAMRAAGSRGDRSAFEALFRETPVIDYAGPA